MVEGHQVRGPQASDGLLHLRHHAPVATASAWVGVLALSVVPVWVHLTVVGRGANPFWWVAAMNVGQGLVLVPFLFATRRAAGLRGAKGLSAAEVLGASPDRGGVWTYVTAVGFWMVPARMSFAFLVWATEWVGTAAAAVVGQYLVPLAVAALLALTGRSVLPRRWPLVGAMAAVGVWLVAAGESGGVAPLLAYRTGWPVLIGLSLAMVSTLGAAASVALNLVYGDRLSAAAAGHGSDVSPGARLWWVLAAMAGSCFAVAPLNLAAGWWLFGPAPLADLWSGLLFGATAVAVGGTALRVANALSRSAAVNAPMLLALPLAVLWLLLAGAAPPRLDLYLAGVVLLLAVVWHTSGAPRRRPGPSNER